MILDKIIGAKRKEVASLKVERPLSRLEDTVRNLPPPRDFKRAIGRFPCSIIAEVKRHSPSKGRIRQDFDPLQIAILYQCGCVGAHR
jgi:indole-3-glycerol phosphate synthase